MSQLEFNIDHPPAAIAAARAQFPMLKREMNGEPLIYLDSGATSLKPQCVIDRLVQFYSNEYGTVRRGVYALSQEATAMYEGVRSQAAAFFNAEPTHDVIFVRGVTEAINLVAISFSRGIFEPGDEVLITGMEHHANIVPWQLIAEQTGVVLKHVRIEDSGDLDLEKVRAAITSRTKLVSVVHVANSLGTVNPVAEISKIAREAGAYVLIDGAQSAPHMPVDIQAIDCDFFACSGHKMLAPTGVGMLIGRRDLLEKMAPYQGGGEMIDQVTFEGSTFESSPHKFEAGTPPFAQVVGMGAALTMLSEIGMDTVAAWDDALLKYTEARLRELPAVRLQCSAAHRSGLVPFTVEGAHPFDVATLLSHEGVAIRAGHHCAQPVMRRYDVPATARASFYLYNNKQDIDAFVTGLKSVCGLLL